MVRAFVTLSVGAYCLAQLYTRFGLEAAALGFVHALACGVFMMPRGGKRF